jgi:hypothetical protein
VEGLGTALELYVQLNVHRKVGVVSLLVAGLAIVALAISTWFSIKYNARIAAQEHAASASFKGAARQPAQQLEAKIAELDSLFARRSGR